LLNIFDPLNAELAARSARRVAVFGTRFVIESDLYGMAPGVEIVRPQPSEIDTIHTTYTELAAHGEASPEQHRILTALAHTLQDRDGVDAIIFAGTDLSLLFHSANTDFPAIDCAALHIAAIMRGLLDGT
jgi:aspartate racemase